MWNGYALYIVICQIVGNTANVTFVPMIQAFLIFNFKSQFFIVVLGLRPVVRHYTEQRRRHRREEKL